MKILVLIAVLTFTLNICVAEPIDYSNLSQEERGEIEKMISEFLMKDGTRDEFIRAGLISPLSVLWDNGLRINSEDGNFKFKFGGRIMNDWGWFNEDSVTSDVIGDQVDGTEFRRARLYVSGDIYKNISFKSDFGFAGGGGPSFKDMYIKLKNIPYLGNFTVGHFKEPFSLEYMASSKYNIFMERGLNNVFAPERNTGFMLNNHFLDKRMTYAVGMFRNANDWGDSEGDSTTEGGYSFTGRITGTPYYKEKGRKLIHTGFSYTHQNAFEDGVRFRQKPEMHMADNFVDTGRFPAEHFNIFNPEIALVYGSFSLQTEYTYANIGVEDFSETDEESGVVTFNDFGDNPEFTSWYIAGSYFITGENRQYDGKKGSFGRIKPFQNFDWNGGWGAIELTARYSELDLNDEDVDGGRLADTTLGANWYLNPNTKIMANYVHADADLQEDDNLNADLFAIRFQIDF